VRVGDESAVGRSCELVRRASIAMSEGRGWIDDMPSYRVLLAVGSLRPGVQPDVLLPRAAASAAELTTVEANDIMMVRGEPQLVVRFTGADDEVALHIGAVVESTVGELADVLGGRVARRDGGAWTLVGAV
jgi:hypothetical protein